MKPSGGCALCELAVHGNSPPFLPIPFFPSTLEIFILFTLSIYFFIRIITYSFIYCHDFLKFSHSVTNSCIYSFMYGPFIFFIPVYIHSLFTKSLTYRFIQLLSMNFLMVFKSMVLLCLIC